MALGVCAVRSQLGIVECLKLTRAFAGTYVCDCGVIWRLMVLGLQRVWAGARVFRKGADEEEGAWVGGFVMWL